MSETAAPAAAEATATTGSQPAQNAGAQSQNPGSRAPGSPDSAQPVAATEPTKAELRDLAEDNLDAMVNIKVNGQMKKVTVRQALKQAELGEGAQLKMQEAAQVRKQAEMLLKLAKSDPDRFFQETGIDADQFAETRLLQKYERLAMTPEQKKNLEIQEKLQKYEAREKGERSQIINQIKQLADSLPEEYVKALEGASPQQLQGELKAATERYQSQIQQIQGEFIKAWESTSLPKDTIFGSWMSSLMHASQVQKNAGEREQALSAQECADIVKSNFLSAVGRITSEMDVESLSQLLGPETMKKIREFDIKRVTDKAPKFDQQSGPGSKPASTKKNSKSVNEQGWKQVFSNIS